MPKNLFDMLQSTAERVPDRIAYCAPDLSIDYARLLRAALSVGTCVAKSSAPQRPVAVLMDARSAWCVPVLFGVLAAGDFYAPLDPALPEERLRLIFSNLRPAMIIADEKQMEKAAAACPDAIIICGEKALGTPSDEKLVKERLSAIAPDDIAMVLYTSGSTGIPKGVAHTHKAMLVWTETTINKYGITQDTVLANQSPWYYANSLLELFVPIALGAKVVMLPPSYLSFPKRLISYLQEMHVTELCMTPSGFVAVANAEVLSKNILPELTMFIMSGEVMPKKQLLLWMDAAPNAAAMNFYGSTETLSVAVDRVTGAETDGVLPVGRLLPNVRIRLMREDGTNAKQGEMGEIYVSSPMVTMGYYRDAERTKSVLVADPLHEDNEQWFKTGDFGMFNADNSLFVVGRRDSMIKHHGYRMELGEVEAAVRTYPDCREACCMLKKTKDEIWCFISGNINEVALRTYLKARLAKYMLPDKIVVLDAMPHNANMKIDRGILERKMEQEE